MQPYGIDGWTDLALGDISELKRAFVTLLPNASIENVHVATQPSHSQLTERHAQNQNSV